MSARKRSTRLRNAPPLPWKYSTTGLSPRGGRCQTMTLSPSLVSSATSWASGKPAIAGGVCSRSGKYISERCATYISANESAERGSGDNQPFEQRHGSFDSMGTGASKSGPNAGFPGERLCYEGNSAARERGQQLSDARTVDPAQSSECKLGITRGVTKPVLRWLAGIVAGVIQPFRYFSRPTRPESSDVAAEKNADGVVEEAQAVVTAIEDAVVRP